MSWRDNLVTNRRSHLEKRADQAVLSAAARFSRMARPMMTESHLTSVAMDHVRLSYCYLNEGDVDAYCSLFAEQAVHRQPGTTPVTGRTELERVERARKTPIRHSIYQVFAAGRQVTAIGLRHVSTHTHVHFIDIFTVADNGLLADRTTYLFRPKS